MLLVRVANPHEGAGDELVVGLRLAPLLDARLAPARTRADGLRAARHTEHGLRAARHTENGLRAARHTGNGLRAARHSGPRSRWADSGRVRWRAVERKRGGGSDRRPQPLYGLSTLRDAALSRLRLGYVSAHCDAALEVLLLHQHRSEVVVVGRLAGQHLAAGRRRRRGRRARPETLPTAPPCRRAGCAFGACAVPRVPRLHTTHHASAGPGARTLMAAS